MYDPDDKIAKLRELIIDLPSGCSVVVAILGLLFAALNFIFTMHGGRDKFFLQTLASLSGIHLLHGASALLIAKLVEMFDLNFLVMFLLVIASIIGTVLLDIYAFKKIDEKRKIYEKQHGT